MKNKRDGRPWRAQSSWAARDPSAQCATQGVWESLHTRRCIGLSFAVQPLRLIPLWQRFMGPKSPEDGLRVRWSRLQPAAQSAHLGGVTGTSKSIKNTLVNTSTQFLGSVLVQTDMRVRLHRRRFLLVFQVPRLHGGGLALSFQVPRSFCRFPGSGANGHACPFALAPLSTRFPGSQALQEVV